MLIKIINHIEWLSCNCKYHEKVIKRTINLVSESPNQQEAKDNYDRKKRNHE